MRKLGLCLLIGVFVAAFANAQSQQPAVARLGIRIGLVEVQRGIVWQPLFGGEPLNAGERVRTGKGSRAAIELGVAKVITLNEQSQVHMGQAGTSPAVQLESGSMKMVSETDLKVSAGDTILETVEPPVDLELGYQANRLNLTIFHGAVRSGPITIRGGNQDPMVRTYTANGRSANREAFIQANPTLYVYPFFLYGNQDPNAGRIVPPVVNNPTNPGYRPTQVVPPMSDPIRVPTTPR